MEIINCLRCKMIARRDASSSCLFWVCKCYF
jgi:hypothetical protein